MLLLLTLLLSACSGTVSNDTIDDSDPISTTNPDDVDCDCAEISISMELSTFEETLRGSTDVVIAQLVERRSWRMYYRVGVYCK